MKPWAYAFLAATAALGAASCAPHNVKTAPSQPPPEVQASTAPAAIEASAAAAAETAASEGNIRGGEFQTIAEIKPVFFDYDKATLSDETRAILKDNAAYLKGRPDLQVQVEGYCDQRGTVEYNLALGERRAKGVWNYYAHLGVPASSMATISYGKEKPFCAEMAESCWSQNRRAQTSVRKPESAPAAPSGPAPASAP